MSPRSINRFFRVLASHCDLPATIILTGAAAGSLLGRVRPSLDIDFAVLLRSRRPARWRQFEAAVARTVRVTGIQANYAQDIDRWGAITLLDYRRHTLPYRRVGPLTIRLLHPAYWSIGKVSRYLDPDVSDLVAVLKRRPVPPARLVSLWGRALRESPPSTAGAQFRHQAEHFLRAYGRDIWGRRFDSELIIRRFRQAMEAAKRAR